MIYLVDWIVLCSLDDSRDGAEQEEKSKMGGSETEQHYLSPHRLAP